MSEHDTNSNCVVMQLSVRCHYKRRQCTRL